MFRHKGNVLRWKMEMRGVMKSNVKVIMLVAKPKRKAHGAEDEVPAWSTNTQCIERGPGRIPHREDAGTHTSMPGPESQL